MKTSAKPQFVIKWKGGTKQVIRKRPQSAFAKIAALTARGEKVLVTQNLVV